MSLRHALLGLLAERPRTGYALLKHFEGSLNYVWTARHSQIYPELARLQEQGLIRQSASGPRGSKTYELLPAGLAEVRRWLLETRPDRRVRSDPLLRVFLLWLLEAEEREAFLRRELEHNLAYLDELERLGEGEPANGLEQTFRFALEHGLRATRARIGWLEWALEQPALSGKPALR
jgi:DNA-binding PadR family transcriptional regulator